MENLIPNQEEKEFDVMNLKKDKKHRQLLRQAILKGKDPQQIIAEIEKLDMTEYNGMQSSQYMTAIKDKRKRLKVTLDRILDMYAKNDETKWFQLKNQMDELEKRRLELDSYFEAVRFAELVQLSTIPPPPPPPSSNDVSTVPQASAISEIPLAYVPQSCPQPQTRRPPGPPSGLPQIALHKSQPKDANFDKTTIEKKPQPKNLLETSMKFAPMSLRVKKLSATKNLLIMRRRTAQQVDTSVRKPQKSTDDSYREFIHDMKPLLKTL